MIFAIGDVHGQFRKLERLLAKIAESLRVEDRLVFLGDYIDRGPRVPEVLDLLIDLKASRPNSIFLRGNHDQVMLEARDVFDQSRSTDLTPHDIGWWFSCGGRETIDSYPPGPKWYERVPKRHWEFLEGTTMEYTEGNYHFVHAGIVPPGKRWREREDPRLWIREMFIGSNEDFGRIVIFGHTPNDLHMPYVMPNKVGIDTAAAFGGPLTALKLDPLKPYDMDRLEFLSAL